MIGANIGHGHVWERPDGMKARCGGPSICTHCAADQNFIIQQNMMREDGMPKSKDERRLRRLLAASVVGFSNLYSDDGEMQYSPRIGGTLPSFDFMRATTDEIENFIYAYNHEKWKQNG